MKYRLCRVDTQTLASKCFSSFSNEQFQKQFFVPFLDCWCDELMNCASKSFFTYLGSVELMFMTSNIINETEWWYTMLMDTYCAKNLSLV